jgi:metallo-beta-lactamase family protein
MDLTSTSLHQQVEPQQYPKFNHHGAVNGVTGSCHQYWLSPEYSLLIDCGLFQGDEFAGNGTASSPKISFAWQQIKAVLLTHVHIDHAGRLPYLIAAGYQGPIYCSEASAVLLPLVLADALKVGVTRDEKLLAAFIKRLKRQLIAVPYNRWITLPDCQLTSVQFRLQVAGHILGSSFVEIRQKCQDDWFYVVFSGDLGASHTPLLPAPKSPERADILILESTYGDVNHQGRKQRTRALQQLILHSLRDNGTILIPAFSIGRTQELLYELEDIIFRLRGEQIHQNLRWDELDIIVDSPLAASFNQAYLQLKQYWDAEALERHHEGRHPLDFSQLTTIADHQQHLAVVSYLARSEKPAIVIAASGMCAGGRIVNYLKAMVENPVHQILFVGYQARGTPGAEIISRAATHGFVELDGRHYQINAEVLKISGFSAHADQQDLLKFVDGIPKKPQEIRIVHGETTAKAALQRMLAVKGHHAVIAGAD